MANNIDAILNSITANNDNPQEIPQLILDVKSRGYNDFPIDKGEIWLTYDSQKYYLNIGKRTASKFFDENDYIEVPLTGLSEMSSDFGDIEAKITQALDDLDSLNDITDELKAKVKEIQTAISNDKIIIESGIDKGIKVDNKDGKVSFGIALAENSGLKFKNNGRLTIDSDEIEVDIPNEDTQKLSEALELDNDWLERNNDGITLVQKAKDAINNIDELSKKASNLQEKLEFDAPLNVRSNIVSLDQKYVDSFLNSVVLDENSYIFQNLSGKEITRVNFPSAAQIKTTGGLTLQYNLNELWKESEKTNSNVKSNKNDIIELQSQINTKVDTTEFNKFKNEIASDSNINLRLDGTTLFINHGEAQASVNLSSLIVRNLLNGTLGPDNTLILNFGNGEQIIIPLGSIITSVDQKADNALSGVSSLASQLNTYIPKVDNNSDKIIELQNTRVTKEELKNYTDKMLTGITSTDGSIFVNDNDKDDVKIKVQIASSRGENLLSCERDGLFVPKCDIQNEEILVTDDKGNVTKQTLAATLNDIYSKLRTIQSDIETLKNSANNYHFDDDQFSVEPGLNNKIDVSIRTDKYSIQTSREKGLYVDIVDANIDYQG